MLVSNRRDISKNVCYFWRRSNNAHVARHLRHCQYELPWAAEVARRLPVTEITEAFQVGLGRAECAISPPCIGSGSDTLSGAKTSRHTYSSLLPDLSERGHTAIYDTQFHSLLARCSLKKTPFDLPVSFSADFNTRLFVCQYRCESWVTIILY